MNKPLSSLVLSSVLIAGAAQALAASATVSTFTGGDPGEGLDMQGMFTYAVDATPGAAGGKVGDAVFTTPNTPGVTLVAQNSIGVGGWGVVAYGETENDINLSRVMSSIRWAAAPNVVTVTLRVEQGAEYKLQILEHEDCCVGRGFNVLINGVTEVENLLPGVLQQGDTGDFEGTKNIVGVVVTKQFVAHSNSLTIVLSGPAATDPAVLDRNAILNGFTLERLTPQRDTDNDGLIDEWEVMVFGNLEQTGAGDMDEDGLTNLEEYTAKTNANNKDSDGDLLTDGAELKTHSTNPLNADTDSDTLNDGFEIRISMTDPTKVDSDGDGLRDAIELSLGSNPNNAASKPVFTSIGLVTGGDPGEGLDLEGNFLYALAAGANPEAAVQVGDAFFQPVFADEIPGVVLVSGTGAANWFPVVYGESEADMNLAFATSSIRYSSIVDLTMDGLEPGAEYKLQLLFGEACCNRGFGIYQDGQLIVQDFNPGLVQGGVGVRTQSTLVSHTFYAKSSSTTIRLDVAAATFPDVNAILNAATLEQVAAAEDTDGDGLPDRWETAIYSNLAQTGAGDADSDTISNAEEFANGTNPNKSDTDNDGLSDSQEATAGSNPGFADSDLDRLSDNYEVATSHTNPAVKDTDEDGLNDFVEINTHLTDPTKNDTDGDGVLDGIEIVLGKNPLVADREGLTSVGLVKGGDTGEGLDLQGEFLYALAMGAGPEAFVQVGDAAFQPLFIDEVPGALLGASTTAGNWYQVVYGESEADLNLALATSSIRYRGMNVTLDLSDLQVGAQYKIQLIFGEACCNRGFNVFVDGGLIVKDFNPGVIHGVNNRQQSAAITHTFFAKKSSDSIRLDAAGVPFPDTNPIINAATLEKVAAPADTDTDALPDGWEMFFFGNLNQSGTSDTDNDGINNALEFKLSSDPLAAEPNRDSDNDTLLDLAEINTHKTDPGNPDTDGDGLTDASEINAHLTDPLKSDTDGDGASDSSELAFATNPLLKEPATQITKIERAIIYGADDGEGLDFEGNFVYAVNVGPAALTAGNQIGDAVFTGDTTPGVNITAQAAAANWYAVDLGETVEDDILDQILSSIRYGGAPTGIPRPTILLDVVPGTKYKLQVILGEACCEGRGFDIVVDGQPIVEDFFPAAEQGGLVLNTGVHAGVVVSAEIETQRNKLALVMDGAAPSMEGVFTPDRNAIINGFTLEQLSESTVGAKINSIVLDAGGVTFTFTSAAGKKYALEYKESLDAPSWSTVNGDITGSGATTSYRDGDSARRAKATGFYRIRSL
ncbi:MAG: hypothetical protein ACO1QB_13045 [Verrucomicrobiales bacterium]